MSDLFEKSMRTLELPAVLEMLAQRAVSDEAKERCRRLRPSTEAETVSHLLDETDAAKVRLGLHGSPSFTGEKDVAQPLIPLLTWQQQRIRKQLQQKILLQPRKQLIQQQQPLV